MDIADTQLVDAKDSSWPMPGTPSDKFDDTLLIFKTSSGPAASRERSPASRPSEVVHSHGPALTTDGSRANRRSLQWQRTSSSDQCTPALGHKAATVARRHPEVLAALKFKHLRHLGVSVSVILTSNMVPRELKRRSERRVL